MKPCVHGGRVAEIRETAQNALDFSASLNPFLHPRIEPIVNESTRTVYNYPDNTYARFRDTIAAYLGVPSVSVIPGNGSMELIRLCAMSVLNEGDTVVVPAPTFDEYEFACRLAGADPLIIPAWERDVFQKTVLHVVDTQDVKMVFLCNPNNPTGMLMKREAVLDIAAACAARDTFLFVDEVFIELSDPGQSIVQMNNEHVFVLRSLTKSFSIPGIRVGYGITGPAWGTALESIRPPWSLNSVAAETACRLLGDCEEYLRFSRTKLAAERGRLLAEVAAIPGLRPLASDVNFLMIDISGTGISSNEFAQRLLHYGILVRDCSTFRLAGVNFVRIAVRTSEENDRLLDAIRRALGTTA